MFQQSSTLKFLSNRVKVRSEPCYSFKHMEDLCQTGETLPRHTVGRGQPKRLEEPELDLVQVLIKCRPLITYKEIKANIEAHSTPTASISAIGPAVRDRLPEGKMT